MIEAELVDTHCHLTVDAYQDDLEQVIDRARHAGVSRILVPGIDLESSQRAIQLSLEYAEIYAGVGIHPHAAQTWDTQARACLRDLAQQPKVVAIGEIGLDLYRNLSTPEAQVRCLKAQLELAKELGLPVVVHNRQAIEELLEILLPWRSTLTGQHFNAPGALHAFSADEESARRALEYDFYLGIAGPITFKKAEELRTLVYNLPIERLLIETDSPYLTPDPRRGKRNEPANVEWILGKIASIRGVAPELIAKVTTSNAQTLFNWTGGDTDRNIL